MVRYVVVGCVGDIVKVVLQNDEKSLLSSSYVFSVFQSNLLLYRKKYVYMKTFKPSSLYDNQTILLD